MVKNRMRAFTFLAGRFVAGDTAADAIKVVRKLNERGLKATLDFLGEECRSRQKAADGTMEYVRLINGIAKAGLKCHVSIKLTQFGLNLDPALAKSNIQRVLEAADKHGNFVRLDMEGSDYTQKTLDLFYEVFEHHRNVGAVIQAYLLRSKGDIERLNLAGARVRLCKGAYKEPARIAFQRKEKVNANFDLLTRELLDKGDYPAIATHDEERIQAAIDFAQEKGIPKEKFEFQMLYGLRPKRWDELAADGYNVRVYVPYGTHWAPYFVRRIRERKENWLFVLKNLVSG